MKTQPLYPQRHRSTGRLLLDFLLAVAAFAAVILLTGCAAPIGEANPLDRPGDGASAAKLHEGNVRAITGNPAWRD